MGILKVPMSINVVAYIFEK